jgi:hypothetical protein
MVQIYFSHTARYTYQGFMSVSPGKYQDNTLKQAMTASFQILTYASFMIIFPYNFNTICIT